MFYDILQKICNEKNVKITNVVLKAGGTKGQLNGWKQGSSPSIDIVSSIADVLDISIDELLGRSAKQHEVIDLGNLNQLGIKKVQEYIKDLMENPKYTEKPSISESMSKTIAAADSFTTATKQK